MIINELDILKGKYSEPMLQRLEAFLINCNLDSSQRKGLVKILLDDDEPIEEEKSFFKPWI